MTPTKAECMFCYRYLRSGRIIIGKYFYQNKKSPKQFYRLRKTQILQHEQESDDR